MTKRGFRYETLLRVRKHFEDAKAQTLGAVRREIRTAEQEHAELLGQQRTTLERAGVVSQAEFDAFDVRQYYQYERYLARLADEKDAQLASLRAEEERRRGELEEAMKQRRIVERLKERQAQRMARELRKAEQHFNDEVATVQAALAGSESSDMKALVFMVLAVLGFLAAVIVPMAATGQLNKDSLQKVLGSKPAPTQHAKKESDPVDPLVQALKKREEELSQRQAKIDEEQARLELVRQELEETHQRVAETLEQIRGTLGAEDEDRQRRLTEIATSLANMKPDSAAKSLEDFLPEEAAEVLRLVKDKQRGKILDKMDEQQRVLVLRSLQERRY